jgi:hypothetical protein
VLPLCHDNHRTGIRDRAEWQSALDNGHPHPVEAGRFRSRAIAFEQRGAAKAAKRPDQSPQLKGRDCTSVLSLFRYGPGMEHAPESMRDGAQPFSHTHTLIAEILPELRPCEMQTIFFQCFEDGPETLLPPIEAEFARRGLSPYGKFSTDCF